MVSLGGYIQSCGLVNAAIDEHALHNYNVPEVKTVIKCWNGATPANSARKFIVDLIMNRMPVYYFELLASIFH
jgi:hypothetical protein